MNSPLTESISNLICDSIFDTDTKNTLKITLANGSEISLNKQFYTYFKKYIMKYDTETTIIKASHIFEYSKQTIKKYKYAKQELDRLNKAESFFNLSSTDNSGNTANSIINSNNGSSTNKSKKLLLNRSDSSSTSKANAIGRAGSSQLNEDFKDIEGYWKKQDENYAQLDSTKTRDLFDIKIPTNLDEDINLNTVISTSPSLALKKEESESDIEHPELSYTGINLSSSLNNNRSEAIGNNKSLDINNATTTNQQLSINTNITTNKSENTNFNFVYGDAAYRALGLYISDFKEEFFSSFSILFIKPWNGY